MNQEKVIDEVLQRKEALFDYKKHRLKKGPKFAFFHRGLSKNSDFFCPLS